MGNCRFLVVLVLVAVAAAAVVDDDDEEESILDGGGDGGGSHMTRCSGASNPSTHPSVVQGTFKTSQAMTCETFRCAAVMPCKSIRIIFHASWSGGCESCCCCCCRCCCCGDTVYFRGVGCRVIPRVLPVPAVLKHNLHTDSVVSTEAVDSNILQRSL